jgi:hypothetical protein
MEMSRPIKSILQLRIGYTTDELRLECPAQIAVDGVDIKLHRTGEQEIAFGYAKDCTFIVGTSSRPVSDSVMASLGELALGHLPTGSSRWQTMTESFLAGDDLGQHVPPRWILPAGLRACFDGTTETIDEAIQCFWRTLRWRSGSSRMMRPSGWVFHLSGWRLDGEQWHSIPIDTTVSISDVSLTAVTEDSIAQVRTLLADRASESLGHSLWREAWTIYQQDPRTALMIGVSAAEIGFKELVADLVPNAEWLAMHVPTPPLVTMLRDFLPQLPARNRLDGRVISPPEETMKLLQEAVRERNAAAHRGTSVKWDRAEKILVMVRDLLWLFDFYRGHSWALARIKAPPSHHGK